MIKKGGKPPEVLVPTPLRLAVTVPIDDVTDTDATLDPTTLGVKFTWKVQVEFDTNVVMQLLLIIPKSLGFMPVVATLFIVTEELPVLLAVIVCGEEVVATA